MPSAREQSLFLSLPSRSFKYPRNPQHTIHWQRTEIWVLVPAASSELSESAEPRTLSGLSALACPLEVAGVSGRAGHALPPTCSLRAPRRMPGAGSPQIGLSHPFGAFPGPRTLRVRRPPSAPRAHRVVPLGRPPARTPDLQGQRAFSRSLPAALYTQPTLRSLMFNSGLKLGSAL